MNKPRPLLASALAAAAVLIAFDDAALSDDASYGLPPRATLDVPLVAQDTVTMKMACGPACIEMLLKFWEAGDHSQQKIARSILKKFPHVKRYRESGILETDPPDMKRYPGTGTITMRDFLKQFAAVDNLKLKEISADAAGAAAARDDKFARLKQYVAGGIPVIVHQHTSRKCPAGHYRIVTGFDDARKIVCLNDPRSEKKGGGRITQGYALFLELWNVDKPWLHYNAIAFNIEKERIEVKLP